MKAEMTKTLDRLEEIRQEIATIAEAQEGQLRTDLQKIEQDLYVTLEQAEDRRYS